MLDSNGQITPNFSLREMIHSDISVRDGILNVPNAKHLDALTALCENVLQPLRNKLGVPVRVSSGFRCRALNSHREVGGAPNSQHLRGEAADIHAKGYTPQQLFDFVIASGIVFDQVIQEFDEWVHISYTTRRENRQSAVIATRRKDGSAKYTILKK
jgi:zinc D-Ala-D-Ala carboxypeptidase